MFWHSSENLIKVLPFLRDAWNVLGNMPKDEAMENYVNEIKKVQSSYLRTFIKNLLRF